MRSKLVPIVISLIATAILTVFIWCSESARRESYHTDIIIREYKDADKFYLSEVYAKLPHLAEVELLPGSVHEYPVTDTGIITYDSADCIEHVTVYYSLATGEIKEIVYGEDVEDDSY